MSISMFCLAHSNASAVTLIDALRLAGLRGADVSVVYRDHAHSVGSTTPRPPHAAEGRHSGDSGGGDLGSSLGWLIGMGSLALPGIGSLIVAGPILAILSGATMGAATGGLARALIGHGLAASDAKRYEGTIAAGAVLIVVTAIEKSEAEHVRGVMAAYHAECIATAIEPDSHTIADTNRTDQMRASGSLTG